MSLSEFFSSAVAVGNSVFVYSPEIWIHGRTEQVAWVASAVFPESIPLSTLFNVSLKRKSDEKVNVSLGVTTIVHPLHVVVDAAWPDGDDYFLELKVQH